MATAMTAAAAAAVAAFWIRRRRRSRMPAASEFCATGPIGGSPTRAPSSRSRSDLSSMPGLLGLVAVVRPRAGRTGVGQGVAQYDPQLVQRAGTQGLHRARRAAEHIRRL